MNLGKPEISVIIPTWNSESFIERCIKSINSQSFPRKNFELIIVDDGSTDNTIKLAHSSGADLVVNSDHHSAGRARNIGIKHSKGKILAFIDSDCIAENGWLETISKELESSTVICGPVSNGYPKSSVAWAEYLMEFSEFNLKKNRSSVRFAVGCNAAYLRDPLLSCDGFPEGRHFPEEVILCYNLNSKGIKIQFIPELRVKHFGRKKLTKYLSNMELLGRRAVSLSKIAPTSYNWLFRSSWYIPLVFVLKIGARARFAIRAKMLAKFIILSPLILLGAAAFCKGVLNELGVQPK
jgi:glycosyltransferase involved in cell wall biosynthesis